MLEASLNIHYNTSSPKAFAWRVVFSGKWNPPLAPKAKAFGLLLTLALPPGVLPQEVY